MESNDAYHQSGLYSHHEGRQSGSNTPSISVRGGCHPSRGSTPRQSTSATNSARWRHHTPTIGRNNSTASNSSNTSAVGTNRESCSLPVSPDGVGHIPLEGCEINERWGSGQILEVEGEGDITMTWLEPETSMSLMEASTVTASTVDSSAELLNSNKTGKCNINEPASPQEPVPNVSPTKSVEENSTDCGLFSFRPSCLQHCANIKIFVFLLSILVAIQQALASGYLNSVITTIEKRYEIPSYLTGVISSMYEIGNVITVIFVSYLGSKRRIPVWIGAGCLVMGFGSLLFVMPQLINDRWSLDIPNTSNETDSNICRAARVRDDTSEKLSEFGFGTFRDGMPLGSPNSIQFGQRENCIKGSKSNVMPVMFFMLAQLLLGAGGSPLLTLGTTYIDDHVKKDSSSMYIGIIYTMVAFGPVLGFLLGGYLLSYFVETGFINTSLIRYDSTEVRWIGMWWGGFLICGLLLFLVSIPFFMFPKTIKKERDKLHLEEKAKEFEKGHRRTKSQTSTCSRHSTLSTKRVYGKDVRDIPLSILKLLVNPIYVMTCLGACMELMIVSGFIVFLPKYLETQFLLSNVQASIFTGGIAIPGACIGTFLGGYLLKRLSLRPKGAIQMVMMFNLIGLSLYGLLFVLGCDNVKMAGTTSPYFNTSIATKYPGRLDSNNNGGFQVNLTAWCNTGCSCRSDSVQPVCGNNGLTYFSPCHAGCTSSSKHKFANCTCIQSDSHGISGMPSSLISGNLSTMGGAVASTLVGDPNFSEVTVVPVATAGPCYIPCNTFLPFMVLLFFMCTVVAISQMPLLMIVLRSVDEEERSFALGVQFVIFRLIAYIPAPIMFGTVIDSTCLMWKVSCGKTGGRCLLYDIEQFRFRFVGICTAIKIISAAIFVFDWLLIRWKYKLDMDGTMTVGDIVNSLMSVDRGGEEEEEAAEDFDDSWLTEIRTNQGPIPASSTNSAVNTTTATTHQPKRTGSLINRALPSTPGHKRSQSGSYITSSRPWVGGHKRSHSSCGYQYLSTGPHPAHGILATQPGHQRRPSSGQQVTFRGIADDPNDLTGVKVVVQGGATGANTVQDPTHTPIRV